MSNSNYRINFTNQFLIAMPNVIDPAFLGSVIYICDHDDRGAIGIIINRPTDINIKTILSRIHLKFTIEKTLESPVYFGGPVQTERGFVLHESFKGISYASSLLVPGGLEMTTSKDVLESIAIGCGPSKFLLTLGYAGWESGQLEEEILQNGWLTVQADPKIIFDIPARNRFKSALSLLGISSSVLSCEIGHA